MGTMSVLGVRSVLTMSSSEDSTLDFRLVSGLGRSSRSFPPVMDFPLVSDGTLFICTERSQWKIKTHQTSPI